MSSDNPVIGADSFYDLKIDNKWIYCGTIVASSTDGRTNPKAVAVDLHARERNYWVSISLSMLSSVEGGDFDEDDTVFADIYSIDGTRELGGRGPNLPHQHGTDPDRFAKPGGVFGGDHLREHGNAYNAGPASYVGPINEKLVLRLFVRGDDWASASFTIMQLD